VLFADNKYDDDDDDNTVGLSQTLLLTKHKTKIKQRTIIQRAH